MKNTEATLYFDGGIRKGLCAYGWILCDSHNEAEVIESGSKTCGEGTSNIAEYRALIAGIRGSLKMGISILHIVGDSQLIVKQVTGVFKVNKPELVDHRNHVLELLEQFDDYTIKWVPRHNNKRADRLVNEVFDRRSQKCSDRKPKPKLKRKRNGRHKQH